MYKKILCSLFGFVAAACSYAQTISLVKDITHGHYHMYITSFFEAGNHLFFTPKAAIFTV